MDKIADLTFIDKYNARQYGIGQNQIKDDTLVFFNLQGCNNSELNNILKLKSWELVSYYEGTKRQKFYFVKKWGYGINGEPVVFCNAGFSPILIRYLQNVLKFTIQGKDQYMSKEISWIDDLNLKYELWPHQQHAVDAWFNAGNYGIIKSPTGSGKSIIGIYIMKKTKVRTLICIHTKDLVMQWYNFIIEQFGDGIRDKIGIVGGLKDNERRELR